MLAENCTSINADRAVRKDICKLVNAMEMRLYGNERIRTAEQFADNGSRNTFAVVEAFVLAQIGKVRENKYDCLCAEVFRSCDSEERIKNVGVLVFVRRMKNDDVLIFRRSVEAQVGLAVRKWRNVQFAEFCMGKPCNTLCKSACRRKRINKHIPLSEFAFLCVVLDERLINFRFFRPGMEGLKLNDIVETYDCVFLDASVIGGVQRGLADRLYEIRFPTEIARYADEIARTRMRWEGLAAVAQKRENMYMTTAVKGEVGELRGHLARCENFNRERWERESKKLAYAKNPFIHPHGEERRGKRWVNHLVEKARQTMRDGSWETMKGEYDAQIDRLKELVNALDGVLQSVQVYDPQGTLNVWHRKASLVDRELVAALVQYVQQPAHNRERGAVVTRDNDLISVFYQVVGRLAPYVRDKVSPRVDLYFYPPASEEIAERKRFDTGQWGNVRRHSTR